jgi:hypothetical protein
MRYVRDFIVYIGYLSIVWQIKTAFLAVMPQLGKLWALSLIIPPIGGFQNEAAFVDALRNASPSLREVYVFPNTQSRKSGRHWSRAGGNSGWHYESSDALTSFRTISLRNFISMFYP